MAPLLIPKNMPSKNGAKLIIPKKFQANISKLLEKVGFGCGTIHIYIYI